MTPRETFEKYSSGEISSDRMGAINAMVAKKILRRQAGWMARESCLEKIEFTPDTTYPWMVSLTFGAGDLSPAAQTTLANMRENAHEAYMAESDGGKTVQITFSVYTFDDQEDEVE